MSENKRRDYDFFHEMKQELLDHRDEYLTRKLNQATILGYDLTYIKKQLMGDEYIVKHTNCITVIPESFRDANDIKNAVKISPKNMVYLEDILTQEIFLEMFNKSDSGIYHNYDYVPHKFKTKELAFDLLNDVKSCISWSTREKAIFDIINNKWYDKGINVRNWVARMLVREGQNLYYEPQKADYLKYCTITEVDIELMKKLNRKINENGGVNVPAMKTLIDNLDLDDSEKYLLL